MAGAGTGYPIWFACPEWRRLYYKRRRSQESEGHLVTLTGRTRKTPRNGLGHPRKSWTTFEFECACGHSGWSSHKDLERRAERDPREFELWPI